MTNEISQYSAWFRVGEILVDESKQDITAEQAVEKIREIMQSMQKPIKGEWLEKDVIHEAEASTAIDEWQSARCSVCGKYHTTPYLYYFNDYDYCPSCGARMRGEEDVNA